MAILIKDLRPEQVEHLFPRSDLTFTPILDCGETMIAVIISDGTTSVKFHHNPYSSAIRVSIETDAHLVAIAPPISDH